MSIAGQNAEGMGPSKKVAKRNAAEKMLELLGFKVPQPQPSKPALKTDEKVSVCLLTAFTLHQKHGESSFRGFQTGVLCLKGLKRGFERIKKSIFFFIFKAVNKL